jgi:hypothetical protein
VVAVARVQAQDYESSSYHWRRPVEEGSYSVITVRDMEKDSDFEALGKLPRVAGVVGMKRILLDHTLNSDLELRSAAARLHANLLLFYTLDTVFETEERVRPLAVITLGLFPNQKAKVTCTASAVLMDVHNGYVYSVVEATEKDDQLANAWSSAQATDDVRKRVERKAFEGALASFKGEWGMVLANYDRGNRAQGGD